MDSAVGWRGDLWLCR